MFLPKCFSNGTSHWGGCVLPPATTPLHTHKAPGTRSAPQTSTKNLTRIARLLRSLTGVNQPSGGRSVSGGYKAQDEGLRSLRQPYERQTAAAKCCLRWRAECILRTQKTSLYTVKDSELNQATLCFEAFAKKYKNL